MKLKFLFILAVFSSETLFAMRLELIPKGRPYRLTFADPREIRMSLQFHSDSRLTAAVGNYFSLVEWNSESSNPWRAHFGLEGAGYFTMRHTATRFPLETTDGLIGAYLETQQGEWQGQIRLTHISAHLSDGISNATPLIYSRESVVAKAGWSPDPTRQCYGAVHMLVHTIPELPRFAFQLGGYYFWEGVSQWLLPYIATDLKFSRESSFSPSWSWQMGMAINNPSESYRSFRLFYSYYTGADPRGQFYFRNYTSHALGLEMQI